MFVFLIFIELDWCEKITYIPCYSVSSTRLMALFRVYHYDAMGGHCLFIKGHVHIYHHSAGQSKIACSDSKFGVFCLSCTHEQSETCLNHHLLKWSNKKLLIADSWLCASYSQKVNKCLYLRLKKFAMVQIILLGWGGCWGVMYSAHRK